MFNALTPVSGLSGSALLSAADLDYEVKLGQRGFMDESGEWHQVTKGRKFSVYVDDSKTEISQASGRWQITQNSVMLQTFESFCEKTGLSIVQAGSTGVRDRVFFLAEMPTEYNFDVRGVGDMIKPYIAFVGSHRNGVSHQFRIVTKRLSCTNGQTVKSSSNLLNIHHVGDFNTMVAKTVTQLENAWGEYCTELSYLASQRVNAKQSRELLIKILGKKNVEFEQQAQGIQTTIDNFENNFKGGHTAATQGTMLGLLEAATQYTTHQKDYARSTVGVAGSQIIGTASNQISKLQSELLAAADYYANRKANNVQRVTVSAWG